MLCDKTIQCTADILIPYTLQKGNHSIFLTATGHSGWWVTPPSVWNLRSKWAKYANFDYRHISAYNVSAVRDSEICSVMTNRKSPRAFQRAVDGVAQKAIFCHPTFKHLHLCLPSINVSKHFSSGSLFLALFSDYTTPS